MFEQEKKIIDKEFKAVSRFWFYAFKILRSRWIREKILLPVSGIHIEYDPGKSELSEKKLIILRHGKIIRANVIDPVRDFI